MSESNSDQGNILITVRGQEKTEVTQRYHSRCSEILSSSGVESEVFKNPQSDVVAKTTELLREFDVEEGIFDFPCNLLTCFALADMLITEDKKPAFPKSKQRIINMFKGSVSFSQKSMSGVVEFLSKYDIRSGALYDSNRPDSFSSQQFDRDSKYIDSNFSSELSDSLRARFDDWKNDSSINTVRERLGITQQTERPFDLKIVNKNSTQFAIDLTVDGIVTVEDDKCTVVAPKDISDRTLAHEYAHTQSQAPSFGINNVVLSAMEEAYTESLVPEPTYYKLERFVYDKICSLNDQIPELMRRAYLDSKEHGEALVVAMLNTLGSEDYIRVAFMNNSWVREGDMRKEICYPGISTAMYFLYKY
jgi:hypothetical protein